MALADKFSSWGKSESAHETFKEREDVRPLRKALPASSDRDENEKTALEINKPTHSPLRHPQTKIVIIN
jgi:hypothetical protein